MAERDRDDLEREDDFEPENDVTSRADEGDELDEEEFDDEEGEALEDERATGEIGSEGGSPGDRVSVSRSRVGSTRGSEATETWSPDRKDTAATDRTDDLGRPRRRSP